MNPRGQEQISEQEQQAPTARRPGQSDGDKRQDQSPEPVAAHLAGEVALGRFVSVHRAQLGVRVTGPDRALPPLAEARHRRVVLRHLRIDANDFPPALAQAKTKLRLFAGDYAGVVAIHLL